MKFELTRIESLASLNITLKAARWLILFFLLLIAGCEKITHPSKDATFVFDEVVVANKTAFQITNVTLRDKVTNNYFHCSQILPKSQCSIGFAARQDQNHGANLEWTSMGKSFTSAIKATEQPVNLSMGIVRIDILPNNTVHTYFQ